MTGVATDLNPVIYATMTEVEGASATVRNTETNTCFNLKSILAAAN